MRTFATSLLALTTVTAHAMSLKSGDLTSVVHNKLRQDIHKSGSPLYTLSDQGTNVCPDGYVGIEDRATCEAEAELIKNVLRDTQVRAPEHSQISIISLILIKR